MKRIAASIVGILLVVGMLLGSRSMTSSGLSRDQDPRYAARRACIDDVANHSDEYQDEGALSAAIAGCRHD